MIIPAYNEQRRLPQHLGPALDYLRAHFPSFELLVVDDGSTDRTAEVVSAALVGEPRARLISYQPNRGKGCAIRTGVLASRGEVVVFLDADFLTPIEEVPLQFDVDNLATGRYQNVEPLVASPQFQFVYETVTNETVMDRLVSECDVIFHLAAAVGVELIVKDPVWTTETNFSCEHGRPQFPLSGIIGRRDRVMIKEGKQARPQFA